MGWPLFWVGIPTTTTASVVVRSITTGTVTVNCNGSPFTGDADTTVQDGLIEIPITGLSSDTKYPYTVTNPNGDTGTGVLRTFPVSGDVKIAWYSCNNAGDIEHIRIMNEDPHCVICAGDIGYFAGGRSWNIEGQSYPNISLTGGSTNVDDYRRAQAAYRAITYGRKMRENFPFAFVPDDHEWDINNVAWDIFEPGGPYEYDLNIIPAFAEGTTDYMLGNPPNIDSPGDANPFYFRFECGDAELFVLSAAMHGIDDTDIQKMLRDVRVVGGNNISCIGRNAGAIRNQENWLLARLAASTKKYKIVISPKQTLKASYVNGDSWSAYPDEMDRVLQSISDETDTNGDPLPWAVSGGTMFGTGDWHSPGIYRSTAGASVGQTYDHVAVNASPLAGWTQNSGPASEYTIYHYEGVDDAVGIPEYVGIYGVMETTSEKITAKIKNWLGNVVGPPVSVNAGENKLAV